MSFAGTMHAWGCPNACVPACSGTQCSASSPPSAARPAVLCRFTMLYHFNINAEEHWVRLACIHVHAWTGRVRRSMIDSHKHTCC